MKKSFIVWLIQQNVVIRQSLMFETMKKKVCAQTIFCINDAIYYFLITYLLLDTINFARSRICLSEAGKSAIIVHALYGLKSVGAAFQAHLASFMHQMEYTSCKADPDLWLKAMTRPEDNVRY